MSAKKEAPKKEDPKPEAVDLGEARPAGKKKLLIIIAAAVLVLALGGGATIWFFLFKNKSPADPAAEAAHAEEDVAEKAEKKAKHDKKPALYFVIKDPFTGFWPDKKPKVVRIGIALQYRDPALEGFLKGNDPVIRDRVGTIMLGVDSAELKERAGKEKLQAELLEALNAILEEHEQHSKIEALYFTEFILQ
ncbi:MAG: flagellar basal body-associated FliL family protein [Pseudomonadota bacterium]